MDLALAFNIATALIAFLGGWLIKTLRDDISALKRADQEMAKAFADLRAELPDRFVRRDDFKEALDNIFSAVRRLEDKLDQRAER